MAARRMPIRAQSRAAEMFASPVPPKDMYHVLVNYVGNEFMRAPQKTYYEILEVAANASQQDITAAYERKIAALEQSDTHDKNTLVILREVHQVLSSPTRRTMYDQSLQSRAAAANLPLEAVVEEDHSLLRQRWVKWLVLMVVLAALLFYALAKKASKTENHQIESSGVSQIAVAPNVKMEGEMRVVIDNSANTQAGNNGSVGHGLNAEQIFAEVSNSIARIDVFDRTDRQIAIGSGVVIGDGSIITNCHVTARAASLKARVGNETYAASVEVEDKEFDLCRLAVSGLRAKAVPLGKAESLRTGQKVYAIGAPSGLNLTISDGIVSALRPIAGSTVIQTTAPVSPGSSGGGLFDGNGNLVGIVTFQYTQGQNLNFAVPVEWIGEMKTRGNSGSVFGDGDR